MPRPAARADSATVAANANTLITLAAVQSSPALATGYSPSQTLILSNAEKWTNLPGTPPGDNARIGPVMGGGSVTYSSYELSATVSTGQSISPRQAALNLAASTTSTAGYNELNEIRYADSILSASGGGNAYNFSDYRVDALNNTSGTLSSSNPFMIKYAGHHLAYAFTYNFPKFNASTAYVSASPMFLGLEPPDYHSTGTDNQGSTSATASNAIIYGTNSGTAGTFLAMYPGTSGTNVTTVTAANAATTLPARTNVTATAISGATNSSLTISAAADSDNGFYFCKVTNASGTTNSNTVALTVALTSNSLLYHNTASTGTSPAPVISTQPKSATVTTGSSVTFSLTASNATSYQWYKIATTHRAAMEAQRATASLLATAVQADSTLATSALLSGTFSDIVQGVASSSGDTGFPATYPTGTTGRGVLFSSMTTAQQTTLKPLIKGLIEAYVNNAPSDAAATLLADYESDAAVSATYVGYAKGTGAADGTGVTRCNIDATVNQEQSPTNSQHSYIRVDGPRCWVEFVVQNAVLYQSNAFVHYHSIYRDKLSDYGGEFGGFLNGASTATGYTGTTYTRPAFTTQPTSMSGSSVTFTATATANVAGSAVTPAYQWYNTSTGAISGATGSSYTTSTAGSYYVTATTAYGTTASNTVTLSSATATAPTITTQPTSQTVVSGSTATFTVAATGSGTLSYQWYNASGTISGATSASYTTGTAGNYYVVVTNTVGSSTASTTSSTATLTVNTAPTITTQPTSQTVNSGNSATFTVAATGNGTLSYQWYSGTVGSGTAISGATAASYTTATAGTYYVVVTNTLNGTATTTASSTATLTVNSAVAPTITAQPVSQTVNAGASATFSVTATGNGTLTYQWYFAGSAISGATSSSYTVASASMANAGRYFVVVTNTVGTSSGSTTSAVATLTVNTAPTITTQPASQTVVLGKSASFSVFATGSGTLSYQWYKGTVGSGTVISGATSSTYTVAQTTSASAGSYYVAVTNSVGTTNSTAATLTVQEPFAGYLSTYGLTGTDPAADSDNDNVSNLVEFVLGGNPTASDPAILPVSGYVSSGGTNYLAYSFYTVSNLGSVTFALEYSTDLTTWTTAVNGTGGVTVTTTAYSSDYNLTTATIPDASGAGRVFARLRATLPSTYTGTVSAGGRAGN